MTTNMTNKQWVAICNIDDILPNMGRCALFNNKQVAIFRVLDSAGGESFYAIDNYCPFSHANTLSRGITGNIDGKTVISSPLYKQHFDLLTGICLEDKNVKVNTYPVRLDGHAVLMSEATINVS
ncbi:MAG: nitrite reductase small subunit NirD [Colwellia sp.]|nr:nitrite reductase small subunit NirD [Colwellia sp.]